MFLQVPMGGAVFQVAFDEKVGIISIVVAVVSEKAGIENVVVGGGGGGGGEQQVVYQCYGENMRNFLWAGVWGPRRLGSGGPLGPQKLIKCCNFLRSQLNLAFYRKK